ncbi:MAG: winged helix-turn-helix domain-containing protein [Pleurocapsa sp. MO_226.B13]|nr:winged helix-turn-helix domain-containing protein [Pleurocapsa sp. MO_226.B13]
MAATPPQKREQKSHQPRWTLKRLGKWLESKFGLRCCRETVRKALRGLGFSWKKARKLLNKANPQKRGEFLEQLESLLEETVRTGRLLVYIDEAHIYLDTDEGYGWSIEGERFWGAFWFPWTQKSFLLWSGSL